MAILRLLMLPMRFALARRGSGQFRRAMSGRSADRCMAGPSEAKLKRLIDEIVEQLMRCTTKSLPEKDARAFLRLTIDRGLNPPVEAAALRPHRIKANADGLRDGYDPAKPQYRPRTLTNVRKRWSANQAFLVWCKFSNERPTVSAQESAFWLATQKLHEAIGGAADADVTRACQAVLRDNKEEL